MAPKKPSLILNPEAPREGSTDQAKKPESYHSFHAGHHDSTPSPRRKPSETWCTKFDGHLNHSCSVILPCPAMCFRLVSVINEGGISSHRDCAQFPIPCSCSGSRVVQSLSWRYLGVGVSEDGNIYYLRSRTVLPSTQLGCKEERKEKKRAYVRNGEKSNFDPTQGQEIGRDGEVYQYRPRS